MKVNLVVRHIPVDRWYKPVKWELVKPMHIGAFATVPAKFETDGASVPRLLWWLFFPTGNHMPAAVLHDYLLKEGLECHITDKKFREAVQYLGIAPWRCWGNVGCGAALWYFSKRKVTPHGKNG